MLSILDKHLRVNYDDEGQRATGVAVPTGRELFALLPSVLDNAFKGEL